MPILKKLKAVLDEAKVPYEVFNHARFPSQIGT